MERRVDAATPILPKLVNSMNPIDEQLAHPPEITPIDEPEKKDLLIFNLVFFMTYTFMLITIPINADMAFDNTKTGIASSGK